MTFQIAEEGLQKYPNHFELNSITGYAFFQRYGEEGNEEDFQEALEYKDRSFWIDPYSLTNLVLTELLMLNRQFHRSIEVCRALQRVDSSPMINFRMGEIYYYMGDLEKSEVVFKSIKDISLRYKIASLAYLGMISAQRREREKALEYLDQIATLLPEDKYVEIDLYIASVYFALGINDEGYAFLRSFFKNPIAQKMKYVYLKYMENDRNFRSVLSRLPDTTYRPFGVTATTFTQSVWPLKVPRLLPVNVSHKRTVLSRLPDTAQSPWGVMATEST